MSLFQGHCRLSSRHFSSLARPITAHLRQSLNSRLLPSRASSGGPPMPFDIVVVMDPIGSITTYKDSTFAMLLEAQRRGHRLLYVQPGGLSVRDGVAHARVSPLRVTDS